MANDGGRACFVIMPFDPKFSRVYDLILAPACRQAGFEPERADTSQASEPITSHLLTRLIESEMVLGDLTSRNPNVLYELGVRHACGGSTVLVQSSGAERIFDIQHIRTNEYDARLTPESIAHDIDVIAAQITSTFERGRAENLVYRTAGSLGFAGRHDQGYRTFLRRVRDAASIRILVTFAYFLNDSELLRDAFTHLASRDGDAKILLLDPSSPAAVQRGQDRPGKDVPAEIRNNLRNLADCMTCTGIRSGDSAFECRIYGSIPPFAVFQCDGEATLVFYEYRKDLRDTQSFTFATGTPLGKYVSGVFEDLWKSADTCTSIEDYFGLRGWFGTYLRDVRYLRGRECPNETPCRPDLWLLLTSEQFERAAEHVARKVPVEIDDVVPGKYFVEPRPLDMVRRVAAQKYGENVVAGLVALAATRRRAAASGNQQAASG